MATDAQNNANQENSKHSTGPRTPEGKTTSSANSRTHGFNAADPVLPTEDRGEYNALLEQNKSEWAPQTAHQQFLVSQLTGAAWKLARLDRMETGMFAALDSPEKAFTDDEAAKHFARLDRYRAAIERTYHRCTHELQAARKIQNEPNSTEAAAKKYNMLLQNLREKGLGDLLYQPTDSEIDQMPAESASNDNPEAS